MTSTPNHAWQLVIALLACGAGFSCSSSESSAAPAAGAGGAAGAAGAGGGDAAPSDAPSATDTSVKETASGDANDPDADSCLGVTANSIGIGLACTKGGKQCATGLACTQDLDATETHGFCMKLPCTASSE